MAIPICGYLTWKHLIGKFLLRRVKILRLCVCVCVCVSIVGEEHDTGTEYIPWSHLRIRNKVGLEGVWQVGVAMQLHLLSL